MRASLLSVAALLLSSTALARGPFIKLERVDASRCADDGWIETFAIELTLEGRLALHPAQSYRLVLDGQPLEVHPSAHKSFKALGLPLHLSLVIQNDMGLRADLPKLKAALTGLVDGLPEQALLSVISYGERPTTLLELGTPTDALEKIDQLQARGRPFDDPVAAFTAGLLQLPKDSPHRKLLVLFSDGGPVEQNRDRVRALGEEARKLGVSIHVIAYTPTDERRALLHLAELSKRSFGTFRWAQMAQNLPEMTRTLGEEILEQQVLRFPMEDRCAKPHEVRVIRGTQRSNPRTIQAQQPKERPWLLWGLGAAVVLALLLGVGVRFLRRT